MSEDENLYLRAREKADRIEAALGDAEREEGNAWLADRLNVAWEILRHVTPMGLPAHLQGELGPVIDDVLEAASRLRAGPEP